MSAFDPWLSFTALFERGRGTSPDQLEYNQTSDADPEVLSQEAQGVIAIAPRAPTYHDERNHHDHDSRDHNAHAADAFEISKLSNCSGLALHEPILLSMRFNRNVRFAPTADIRHCASRFRRTPGQLGDNVFPSPGNAAIGHFRAGDSEPRQ